MIYMGSKNRIASEILPIILKDRALNQYYVEPFCGGCNLIDKVHGNRIANDFNKYLIAMFKELLNGWIPSWITLEEYQKVKKNKDLYPDYYVGYVGFISSFRGIFFGSYNSKKTFPRNYQNEGKTNLLKQIQNLQGVTFYNTDYKNLVIPENSIIYCDPPYKDTSTYHCDVKHEEFYEWCRTQKLNGHTIFVSEYYMPSDFKLVWSKQIECTLATTPHTMRTENLYKL